MVYMLRNEAGLLLLVLFLSISLLARWRLRAGPRPALRPIPAYQGLAAAVREAAESARPLHISLGGGGIGDAYSMQTLAGLQVLRELAQPAATATASLVVTTASPVALPLAQDLLRQAAEAAGSPDEYAPDSVRFVADSRSAFAAGAGGVIRQTGAASSALVGDLRDEYLILAEPAAQQGELLAAGSGDVNAQPFVWATAALPLLGEEIFAAGAYLGRRRSHLASLAAQDVMRLLLVLFVLVVVIGQSLNLI